MENKVYKNLGELFDDSNVLNIKVPSYQRAYSWEEKQLEQFIGDVLEIREKKGYYFGHFIFENENNSFYVIDGQQRITTYILFLITCDSLTNSSKFKTKKI